MSGAQNRARLNPYLKKSIFFLFTLFYCFKAECSSAALGSYDKCFWVEVEAGYMHFSSIPSLEYGHYGTTSFNEHFFFNIKDDQPSGVSPKVTLKVDLPFSILPCPFRCRPQLFCSYSYFDDFLKKNTHVQGTFNFVLLNVNGIPGFFSLLGPEAIDLRAIVARSYTYNHWNFDLRTPLCYGSLPVSISPFLRFAINSFEQKYAIDGNVMIGLQTYTFDIFENFRTHYYDIGGGIAAEYCLPCHLSFLLEGQCLASRAITSLHASSEVGSPFVKIREVHQLWSSKLGGQAGIYYDRFRAAIGIVGTYEYWYYTPSALSPEGLTLTTGIPVRASNSSTSFYALRLSLSAPF